MFDGRSMEKPRVIISVRVSSKEQQEQGFGWDNQMRRLPELVEAQGWEIAKRPDGTQGIYDEGFASTTAAEGDDLSLESRPVMQALLGELSVVQPTYLVCREQDRLHRSTLEWELLQHRMVKAGVEAVVQWPTLQGAPLITRLSESKDQAFASIQAVFSQLQKADMKAKMGAGRRERSAQGLPAGGRLPYGYERGEPKGPLVINEAEAEIYRQIIGWTIEGAGAVSISKRLTRQGIPTMMGKGVWSVNTVRGIVASQSQLGLVRVRRDGAESVWVPARDQPALIDREVWEQAQAVVASRKTRSGDRERRAALVGLLKCSACGHRLRYHRKKKTSSSGRVSTYSVYACMANPYCNAGYSISERKALREISPYINALLESGTYWMQAPEKGDMGDIEGRVGDLETARETARAKVKRAHTAYVDAPEDMAGIALEELHRRRDVLKGIEEELTTAREGYAQAMAGPAEDIDMEALRDLLRGWENLEDTPKRMVLETIIEYADVLPNGREKRLDIHWIAAPVVPVAAATLG
jgi:DNA invertase Pin-like site-specific DNA recombinase